VASRGVRPARREALIVFALSAAACAAGAVLLGQDTNFDQRNYHLYTVYAWLTDRDGLDLAPGQIQTWLNPVSYLPAYALIMSAPPIAAGAVLGALASVNGLVLWLLSRSLIGVGGPVRLLSAVAATISGLTGSMFLSFLGSTFSENLCSPLVVGALAAVVVPAGGRALPSPRRFFAAGACLGAACGLKFTHLIYVVGLAGAFLALWPVYRLRLAHMTMFVAGGAAGFLVLGGYWAVRLWSAYDNPMFPFFNAIFRSPWFDPVNFADVRFLPASFPSAAVLYPFEWLVGIRRTTELPFREPRFAVVAVLLPIAMIAALVRTRRVQAVPDADRAAWTPWNFWLASLFFLFSYIVWARQFSYQRYALSLELLTGPMIVLALHAILRSYREAGVVSAALVTAAMLGTEPQDWRRIPYGEDWYGLSFGAPETPALFVMTGSEPSTYIIPFLPAEHRFVRIGGNMPLEPDRRLGRRAATRIASFSGPIRSLNTREIDPAERARLRRFGLEVVDETCQRFPSRMDTFVTCELVRRPDRR
jgi:hypothetical protein